jgi:hypothetical protein
MFVGNSANSQELNAISSSGNYTEGTSYSIAWTLGEAVIITASSASNVITQGFHQADLKVLSVEEFQYLDIAVYPNPARDNINIITSEQTKLTIFDIQGKIIDIMDIYSSETTIDVSYLSRGTYTLVFETKGALAKRMKIVIL